MPTEDDDDLRIVKRRTPPYWWPDITVLLQLFLSASIIFMVGFILYRLLDGTLDLKQDQRDLLMILFGIILGCFKDVYGYTFGSSAGQKRQGDVITKSLEDKDKIIATNAETTAATATAAIAAAAPTSNGEAMKAAVAAAAMAAPAAAAVAAPAAAAVAAPPAAAVAAPPVVNEVVPPAVEKAVADAMAAHDELEKQK